MTCFSSRLGLRAPARGSDPGEAVGCGPPAFVRGPGLGRTWRFGPALVSLFAFAGCGGDDGPPRETFPAPDVVRTAYGLNAESCWRYRFSRDGNSLFATVTVSGPNMDAVAGRTVYIQKYQLESGGLPTEDYFDTESNGEIRLLRHAEGAQAQNRVTKRYEEDATPPLFAKFKLDRTGQPILDVGERFETNSTPKDLPIERHVWSVLSNAEMVVTPDGDKAAYKLQYNRETSSTAVYFVVPGFGVARFVDFSGTTHQVCAARVCDGRGACAGADSCASLVCPP